MMRKKDIKKVIMSILYAADSDLAKKYDPEVAEEPEECEKDLKRLIKNVEVLTEKYHHEDDIDPTV